MKIKEYIEAENYLNDVPKFAKKNKFEDTQAFYDYLQSDESGIDFKESKLGHIIHVAGTNGKGSVCAYLSQICRESGLKTGFFLSPHLITTRERFQINGEMVSEEEFMYAFSLLEDTLERYQKKNPNLNYIPTYFERLFFMMLILFAKARVKVTVMETGLGGRLDTTNVIRHPAITVITEIGFDHMAYLGNTIEEIAREKAGIIKPDVPVIYMDKKNEASVEIEKRAKELSASCYKVSRNVYKISEIQKKSIDFLVSSRYYDYNSFRLNTSALYQVENAAIAIKAAEVLKEVASLTEITQASIEKGIMHMFWPGRMEEVLPDVFIDGAHNEDGVEAFVETVKNMFTHSEYENGIVLFSAVSDKKYDKMIEMISKIPQIREYVVTQIPGSRGVNIKELENNFVKNSNKKVCSFDKLEDAFSYALKRKGGKDVIFIVGSLYLAGLVEELLSNEK